ncbi:MAG: HNH endonuclease [Alphaproteobacteria bacterium]|nr:MAG: HNH endonuclease [Alphaproteobacteria bacterium]
MVKLWEVGSEVRSPYWTAELQQPYNPRAFLRLLEERYGAENVTPHTVLRVGERNAHLGITQTPHPVTGIPFDIRSFAVFDSVMAYETRVTDSLMIRNRIPHMREATLKLKQSIERGEVSSSIFNADQLRAIEARAPKIPGYTWHHNQELGRMQLLKKEPHDLTGHAGGMVTWFN